MLGISESKQIGTKAYRNGRSCLRCVPSGCVCSDMRNKTESAGNRRCLLVSAGLRMPGHAWCHDTGMWRLPGAYFRRAAHVWAYMRSATSWSRGGLSCVSGSQRRHEGKLTMPYHAHAWQVCRLDLRENSPDSKISAIPWNCRDIEI